MKFFIDTGYSRATSPEIMEAILFAANGDDGRAVQIWDNGPTDEELIVIWERVTHNGLIPAEQFYWGTEGTEWYTTLSQKPEWFPITSG